MSADLHVHTTFSDSVLTPAEVIAQCALKQIGTVAITDHDSINGVAPATEAGRGAGVRVVPGVEMTAYDGPAEIHIIGLFVDPAHRGFNEVVDYSREVRHTRLREIVEKLRKLNIGLSVDDVLEIADGGAPGRMHVARGLVECGEVASIADAFKYFIGNDGPAYVPKHNLTPAEAAAAIRGAGGVSIVAHPGTGLPDALVVQMLGDGIQGIEAYHPLHSDSDVERYLAMADEHGALVSGGSDSHGGVREKTQIGAVVIEDELVDRLERRAGPAGK